MRQAESGPMRAFDFLQEAVDSTAALEGAPPQRGFDFLKEAAESSDVIPSSDADVACHLQFYRS